jgi:alpha-ketoglutarate-dependent taurine dioxygenase
MDAAADRAGAAFPVTIEAPPGSQEATTDEAFLAWAQDQRPRIDALLRREGAVLLRGFAARSAETFERFVQGYGDRLLSYAGGNSPRVRVRGNVYTSTEYPRQQEISLHHELSYAARWPRRLFLFCARVADQGGETTIASGRRVTQRLPPQLVDRFAERGVRYVQHLHAGKGFGRSWQETFETESPEAAEALCRDQGMAFSWGPKRDLHLEHQGVGVIAHPETGERLWFNQAEQWHPSSLDPEVESMLRECLPPAELPLNAFHGDGGALDPDDLTLVREACRAEAIDVRWQTHDVILVDNLLALHGRRAFEGTRQVLVAMVA